MIHIETIDLTPRDITLPSDRVGMVIAQPHLALTPDAPYLCRETAKAAQLAVLTKTLAVARDVPHGAPKTHFTIFPEYSIPGPEGIALIQSALEAGDWPERTIVIGGTDALSKAQFVSLAAEPRTYLNTNHNPLPRIAENDWINCGIIWTKAADGTVERWLQPKLFPAWPEQNVTYQGMFQGDSIFTFKGSFDDHTQYHFSSVVCFDWVGKLNNRPAWRWVLDDLQQQVTPNQMSLSWFFVIQCNPKPSHASFLTEVGSFFDQTTVPNVRRDRTCLVFANSAGRAAPGRVTDFGGTSLIFAPQAQFADPFCHATFSNGGQRFRESAQLAPYRDVYFRERGACIHSFAQVNPASLHAGAAGRRLPVEHPFVFPLNGAVDPRVPAQVVPASVKWLNDELDASKSLSFQYPAAVLAGQADTEHQHSVSALRAIPDRSVTHTVKLAAQQSNAPHADDWDRTEADAVEHLVHTLDIIGLGFPHPIVGADPAHATAIMNGQMVDILAIRGETHERCVEHSQAFVPSPRRQFLLVSRDRDNTPWRRKFGSIMETEPQQLGQERRFADPMGGSLHLGYEKLLDIFRTAATPAVVQGAINAELAA